MPWGTGKLGGVFVLVMMNISKCKGDWKLEPLSARQMVMVRLWMGGVGCGSHLTSVCNDVVWGGVVMSC